MFVFIKPAILKYAICVPTFFNHRGKLYNSYYHVIRFTNIWIASQYSKYDPLVQDCHSISNGVMTVLC